MGSIELWLAKLAVFLLIIAALFGSGMYVEHRYFDAPQLAKQISADQIQLSNLQTKYDQEVAAANSAAAAATVANQQAVNAIATQLMETQDEVTKLQKKLEKQAKIIVAQSSTGAITGTTGGLSINGASCPQSSTPIPVQGSNNSTSSTGTGNQTSCRLSEQTATALISIASDGNAAINQLNSVIDAYNAVREKGCEPNPNAAPSTQTPSSAEATSETAKPEAVTAPTPTLAEHGY